MENKKTTEEVSSSNVVSKERGNSKAASQKAALSLRKWWTYCARLSKLNAPRTGSCTCNWYHKCCRTLLHSVTTSTPSPLICICSPCRALRMRILRSTKSLIWLPRGEEERALMGTVIDRPCHRASPRVEP